MTTVGTVSGTTVSPSASQSFPQNNKRKEATTTTTATPSNGTIYNNNNINSKKKKRRKKAHRVEVPCSSQQQPLPSTATLRSSFASDSGQPSMEVRTISPTVRGVAEAARVLKEGLPSPTETSTAPLPTDSEIRSWGILSFPTETVYTMSSTVRVNSSGSNATPLGQLQRLKQLEPNANKKVGSKDPPLVYVASALHARQFVEFSKPKVYVLTKPKEDEDKTATDGGEKEGSTDLTSNSEDDDASSFSSSDSVTTPSLKAVSTPTQAALSADVDKSSTASTPKASASNSLPATPATCFVAKKNPDKPGKLPAARFSESREVLNRIANVVWPGPTVIYAPAKLDSTRVAAAVSGSGESILPESLLLEFSPREETDTGQCRKYVGMRCPSHPLAQRVLAEVYGTAKAASTTTASPFASPNAGVSTPKMPRSFTSDIAVIGYNASIGSGVDAVAAPTSAKEVCSVLLQQQNKESPSSTVPPVVHVLNGEDRREIFSVPTCQYGSGGTTCIVIDDVQREVRIIRPAGQEHLKRRENGGVATLELLRALHRPTGASAAPGANTTTFPPTIPSLTPSSSSSGESARRVVTAVLRRWKVLEQEA